MMSFGPAALAVILSLPQALQDQAFSSHVGQDQAGIIRVAAEGDSADPEATEDPLLTEEGQASSDAADPSKPSAEITAPDAGTPVEAAAAAPKPAQCETPEDMLLLVAREREQIAEQKAEAEAKIAEAALAAEALAAEVARLEALKAEIDSFNNARSEEQQAELARLVKVYETMKPKEAATLLADLDMGTTMELFGLMKERKAAEIMAKMDPVRARAISRILVEMAKLPGDRDLSGIRIK